MSISFSVRDAVERRISVRSYDSTPLSAQLKKQLLDCAASLANPLGPQMRVEWIDAPAQKSGEKLGTYGFIRNAQSYLAAIVPEEPHAAEALGYSFEQLVLYAASLGLGTCWLGGTFDRSAFAAKVSLQPCERFAILSPIGYPAQKPHLPQQLFRRVLRADARKPWDQLFFDGNLQTPLTPDAAGEYAFPLEMVRLAPSAVNRQPWRVVRAGNAFHFYLEGDAAGSMDMQRIDLGIAACHFHLAAMERGLNGRFERVQPNLPAPQKTYLFSWICG